MVEDIIAVFVGSRENRIKSATSPLVLSALKDLRCKSPTAEPIVDMLIEDYYANSSLGSPSEFESHISEVFMSNLAGNFSIASVIMAVARTISQIRAEIENDINEWFNTLPTMPKICKAVFNDTGSLRSYD